MENFKHLYWLEASGPIGHWKQKYGAIMLPYAVAKSILQITRLNIEIFPVENDDYAYTRKIVGVDEPVKKIMFGFPSQEVFDMMLKDDGYDKYMKEVRDAFGPEADLFDMLKESEQRISHKQYVKNVFYSLYVIVGSYQEENMFYNMLPKTYEAVYFLVKEANKILRESRNIMDREQRIRYRDVYDLAKDILLNANILVVHKLF